MPTVADLVKKARKLARNDEPDAVTILAALQDAEAIAVSARDWHKVGQGFEDYLADGEAARRCLERSIDEQSSDEINVWTYKILARICCEHLEDLGKAREVLQRLEGDIERLERRHTYYLCEAAGCYSELLQDTEKTRVLLKRALTYVTPIDRQAVDDLCDVARAYWEAASQARSPKAASERDVSDWWHLANVYRDMDKETDVERCLNEGLSLAASVPDFLTLASAWESHFHARCDGFIRATKSARDCAQQTQEWLEIAQVYFEAEKPHKLLPCLEQGLAVAKGEEDRRLVADGFRTLLFDKKRADSIAPSGFRPTAIAHQRQELEGFAGEPALLFDNLQAKMTQAMLEDIADADRGNERQQHLIQLQEICETGTIPQPLRSEPQEVLSLISYTEGDEVDHVQRAFVCTVLCIDFCGEDGCCDGHQQTFAALLESCLLFGDEAMDGFVGLMVAAVEGAMHWDESYLFALYGLFLGLIERNPQDERLVSLAEKLETTEPEFGVGGYPRPEHGWLLRTTFFDGRHTLWRELSQRILGAAVQRDPSLTHLARIWGRLNKV
jgi:tetratricopeptide (TPR) repeat protein